MSHTPNQVVQQFLTFRLGREVLAFDISYVREVLKCTIITPIPGATRCIEGIINVRGRIVPIVNIRTRLGLPDFLSEECCMVIIVESRLGDKQTLFGAIVDLVDDVIDLELDCIEPPTDTRIHVDAQFIHGIGKIGDDIVILLDVPQIFSCEAFGMFTDPDILAL